MRRISICITMMAMVAGVVTVSPAVAQEEVPDHVIYVGAFDTENPLAPFTYTRFLPDHLKVRRGDLVEFKFHTGFNAWHSVNFGWDPADSTGMTRDEVPDHFKYPDDIMFGSQPPQGGGETAGNKKACGRHGYFGETNQEPCVVGDPDKFFGSALFDQLFSTVRNSAFRVQIAETAPLGRYKYYCSAHVRSTRPEDANRRDRQGMTGIIEVVEDGAALNNLTEAQIRAEVKKDYQEAQAEIDRLTTEAYDAESRSWTVHVGHVTPSGHVTITDFVPANIQVRRGERVRFIAGSTEPNTVSFPGQAAGSFSCQGAVCQSPPLLYGIGPFSQPWGCDPDGPGPQPSIFFSLSIPRFRMSSSAAPGYGCPSGLWREAYTAPLTNRAQRAPGNLVTHGVFHNSGVMFSEWSPQSFRKKPDGTMFEHEFTATFPTVSGSAIQFGCFAHAGQMKGSVSVVE